MSFLEIFKSVDINKELNRCRTTKGAILLDVRTEEEYRPSAEAAIFLLRRSATP